MNIKQVISEPEGSIDALNLENQLDYMDTPTREKILSQCLGKIRSNGTISIRGLDLILFSKKVLFDNLEDAGTFAGIQSFDSIRTLSTKLHNAGFSVTVKMVDQNTSQYSITAMKNV